MEQEGYTNLLRDFLNVLFKHKLKILTVFTAVVIIVAYRTFSQVPVYKAESSLMVLFGREYIIRSEVVDDNPSAQFKRDEVINADIQILRSTDLLEKVILCLGVENIYPSLVNQAQDRMRSVEAATRRFKNNLSVNGIRNSNVLNVSFKHEDPQIAAQALNDLVDCFMERHLQLFSTSRAAFMERQLSVFRQKLQEAENNLHAFHERNQIYDLDLQRQQLVGKHRELDISLTTAQIKIQKLRQKISSLKSKMEETPEFVPITDATTRSKHKDGAKARILDLQIKEQDLLSKYNEDNRWVITTRKQIQLLKDYLAEIEESTTLIETQGRSPTFKIMEADLLSAQVEQDSEKANVAAIKLQLNQLDGEIKDFDSKVAELQDLQRAVTNNENNYNTYVTKLEEALISDEMDRLKLANIKVIQKANVPRRPVPDKKGLHLAVGIILGSAAGLALALFSEYIIGQDISSPEDVKKRLGLPVLATFPYKGQKKSRA